MIISTLNRKIVLAHIQIAYGSAAAFERANKFPKKSVNEVLRGRANARVRQAIEELLTHQSESPDTELSVATRTIGKPHGLSAGAK